MKCHCKFFRVTNKVRAILTLNTFFAFVDIAIALRNGTVYVICCCHVKEKRRIVCSRDDQYLPEWRAYNHMTVNWIVLACKVTLPASSNWIWLYVETDIYYTKTGKLIIYIPVLFGNDNLSVKEMKHFTRFNWWQGN